MAKSKKKKSAKKKKSGGKKKYVFTKARRAALKKAQRANRHKYSGKKKSKSGAKKKKKSGAKKKSGYARAKGILGARERKHHAAARSTALATLKDRGYTPKQAKLIYDRAVRLAKHRAAYASSPAASVEAAYRSSLGGHSYAIAKKKK